MYTLCVFAELLDRHCSYFACCLHFFLSFLHALFDRARVLCVCVWVSSLQDNRLFDLPLSATFCKRLCGEAVGLDDVVALDAVVGKSLLHLRDIVRRRNDLTAALGSADSDAADVRAKLETLRKDVEHLVRAGL
jgi:hypothetical protein